MRIEEMNKFELACLCIKQKSKIDDLEWRFDFEKKENLLLKGLCPLKKTLSEEIIACVYKCGDCNERREK